MASGESNNNKKPKIINITIKQGAAEYMTTYGDMMTLLLCFFVLLFAMSNIDAKKFEALTMAFTGSAGILQGGDTVIDERIVEKGSLSEGATSMIMEMQSFEDLQKEIEEYLEEKGFQDQVQVQNEDAGLILRFQDNVLFERGSADISPELYSVLDYIGELLKTENFSDKFINVEGHTDDVPIHTAIFPSNWELSVGRSSSVVRYLIEKAGIDPKRISASGYSEYHPILPNDTPENRTKNRRVDVVIMKSKDLQTSNYID